jgi:HlyD family secretion protein
VTVEAKVGEPATPSPHDGPAGSIIQPLIRKYRWPFLVVLLGFLVLAGLTLRWWLGPLVTTETVLRRDFVQTVVASGRVETAHRVDIGAQITGTVNRVPVAEGQAVRAADVLIELEAAELNAVGRQADVAVVQALARLRQLQEVQSPVAAQTLRQAQASRDNARAALTRNQQLFDQGFIGRAALDESRMSAELADAQVGATQKQLDTTGRSGSDRALAVANVAGAQASADAARARAGYAVMRAPVSGTLIARNVEVGDVVQPGKVLLTLSPGGRTQLVVEIDEKNLRLLALGQPAWVSADAYPKERFAAVLAYINPGVNAQTGAVEVKLDVPAPPPVLKQDMTVSVDIEVARRPKALLVPTGTVHEAESAAPWVLRVEGRYAVKQPVRLGLRSGGFAEVVDGLTEGDRVIPVATAMAAGSRLRTAGAVAPSPTMAVAP